MSGVGDSTIITRAMTPALGGRQRHCDMGHGTIAIGDGDNVIATRATTLQLRQRAQAYDPGPGAFLTAVATGCVQYRTHHRWYHFNGESIEFVN